MEQSDKTLLGELSSFSKINNRSNWKVSNSVCQLSMTSDNVSSREIVSPAIISAKKKNTNYRSTAFISILSSDMHASVSPIPYGQLKEKTRNI